MPFFATRRIIEGLGLGLAGRAARKLVPVVLTLGSGPSGFPRKLSRRRLKLPRQPGRGASLALASVILALGAGPLLLETTFRATAEASATAMANPRRRSRALRCSGAGGPSGFPKQFSGRRPKLLRQPPSRSLPSFWRWGVAGRASRNKFPSDESGGILGASGRNGRFINQKRTSGQIFKFGLRMADFILSRVRSLSGQAEPFLSRARIAILSRPASRSGRFVKPRRGASLALASVILALGASPLLLETTFRATAEASATAVANPRRRSRALRCSGAGGWPVGLPDPFWRWGAAGRASRNKFPSDESGGILERQWPQWPFYQPEADKWPDL